MSTVAHFPALPDPHHHSTPIHMQSLSIATQASLKMSERLEHVCSDGYKIYTRQYYKKQYGMDDDLIEYFYQKQFDIESCHPKSNSDIAILANRRLEVDEYLQTKGLQQ
jgi:hypothetical protein